MKTTNQLIDNIYFRNLKCLQEVNISFAPKNVTAILDLTAAENQQYCMRWLVYFNLRIMVRIIVFQIFSLATLMLNGMGVISRLLILIEKVKKIRKELDSYGKAEQKGHAGRRFMLGDHIEKYTIWGLDSVFL